MNLKYLLQSAVALALSAGMAFGGTITFDDIAAGNDTAPTLPSPPPGYGGLTWSNFRVVDGVDSSPSGAHAGVVSPKNVAFDYFGATGIISSPSAFFDLTSAYFTAVWNDNLKLEVRGTRTIGGNALIFDNIYTLSAVTPTLINFNYDGLNTVTFAPSGGTHHAGYGGTGFQFAMDDLTVSIPDAGASSLMFSVALLGLGVLRKKLA